MTFLDVVTRSLKRRPIRTGLTLLGISIGIAAVVALIGLSRGLVTSWSAGMKSRGVDIVVHNLRGSLTPKPFPASTRGRIAHLPGVAATCPILVDLMSIESADLMIVSAREWGGFAWEDLKLVSGRMPNDQNERAVVLGTTAAEILKKKVGDTVQIESNAVSVNGVRFARSAVAERDSRGRPLHHVYFGKYRVSRDQVWLFGFNDRRSWDSRYFGPTPLANVCGRIEPILTW